MLDEADAAEHSDPKIVDNPRKAETDAERITQCRALFARSTRSKEKDLPDPVAILKKCRDELDARDSEIIELPFQRSDWTR